MKNCSKCKELKSFDSFYKDKRYSDNCYPSCKSCQSIKLKKYYINNRDEVIKRDVARKIEKYRVDPIYNLKHKLRSRLKTAIRNQYKSGIAIDFLGCSIEEFKAYMESKFQSGMDWSNNSIHGWHIDHIVSLNQFDLSNLEELKKACHYTNLQPLWSKDNWSKG